MRSRSIQVKREKAILIVESGNNSEIIALSSEVFTIGRHSQCSFVLDDKMVSRHHATIAFVENRDNSQHNGYWIIDGQGRNKRSTNGIFINGTKKLQHQLGYGDIITFGSDTQIIYSCIADTSENIQIDNVILSTTW